MKKFLEKIEPTHVLGLIFVLLGIGGMYLNIPHMGWLVIAGVVVAASNDF